MKRVLDEMGVKSPHLLFQLSLPKLQKVLKELASHDAALQAREEQGSCLLASRGFARFPYVKVKMA